jgi:hypothetical protein
MVPIWKNIPLLRVLLPLITGILTGWYLSLHWQIAVVAFIIALPFFLYLQFSGERSRFYNSWLDGLPFNIIFISLGIALVWLQQKPHQPNWAGHFYKDGDVVKLSLLEPLSEGEKTYKALSEITVVYHQQKARKVTGRVMIYFRKDSVAPQLKYGDVILVRSNKTIVHINQSYRYDSTPKITADVVIVSNNPKFYFNQLTKTINCKLLVFDSSHPQWKLKYWKTDCEKLNIHYFCTSEQGAFVMNL